MLRASLAGCDAATETSFIKVVPPAFSSAHRELLIARSKFASPIVAMLCAMGVDVDAYGENSIEEMSRDLADATALLAKCDAIWLGCAFFVGL